MHHFCKIYFALTPPGEYVGNFDTCISTALTSILPTPRDIGPIIAKHDVIHSTQHTPLAPAEDRALVPGDVYIKFCEVWT